MSINYFIHKDINLNRLVEMFNEVGWTDKTADLNRLKEMVENSQVVVSAWDDDYMIGFARCTTDFVFNGQINNVVVDFRYRKRGIGKELITRIVEHYPKVTFLLRSDPDNENFYRELGFENAERALVYKRRG